MGEISTQNPNESAKEAKIRTPFAKVIARKVGDLQNVGNQRTYFDIMYFDPADKEFYISYGSYNIDYVFAWLERYFEIEYDADMELAPVIHAHWEMRPSGENVSGEMKAYCSNCDKPNKQYKPPYCPHCGAKMEGETDV